MYQSLISWSGNHKILIFSISLALDNISIDIDATDPTFKSYPCTENIFQSSSIFAPNAWKLVIVDTY